MPDLMLQLTVHPSPSEPAERFVKSLISADDWAALSLPSLPNMSNEAAMRAFVEAADRREAARGRIMETIDIAFSALSRYAPALRGPDPKPIIGG